MKVFTVINPLDPLEHIDVKFNDPDKVDRILSNAETLDAGGIKISVVSLDDLIDLKRKAGRDRDLVDIRALERIRSLK